MYFKRPSFRRGGPTGIGQLSSNRQMYAGGGNIGGGGIGGRNLGTRTGFNIILNEFGMPYQKPPSTYKPNFNLKGGSYTPRNYPLTVIPKTLKPLGATASTGGVLAALAPVGGTILGLANMNKAKTLEGLNYMKSMNQSGVFDETDPEGFDEYTETLKKIDDEGKTKITLKDNFLMDEKGRYPKFLGRTEDRDDRRQDEILEELYNEDRGFLPTPRFDSDQTVNMESIVEEMVPNKKIDDDTPKEPTFEDTFEIEKSRIEKLIGDDDQKGMAAIALSEAIGTPGTIADKAAVLNKSLLGIMVGKKKDKKDIAKLAYTATKEIEKAKIMAGKEGFSEKQFNRMKQLSKIISDTTGSFTKEQKAAAQAELSMERELIKAIGGKSDTTKILDPDKALANLKQFEKGAKKLAEMDKNDPEYARLLESYKARIEFLRNYPELMDSIRRIDAITVGVLSKKDGGRIGFANGTPMEESIQVSETVGQGQVPTAQTAQLSFEEIRNRLPKEITDDVVRLISGSNEALQDFSYIRTQGDVDKFNMKYGVTLVLPQNTA
jgi:hypothetical protein